MRWQFDENFPENIFRRYQTHQPTTDPTLAMQSQILPFAPNIIILLENGHNSGGGSLE